MINYFSIFILTIAINFLHAEPSMTLFELEKRAYDNNLLSAEELYRASLAKWFPQVSAKLTLAATEREANSTKSKHYLLNVLSLDQSIFLFNIYCGIKNQKLSNVATEKNNARYELLISYFSLLGPIGDSSLSSDNGFADVF
jgi:hypothetical protein